MALRIAVGFCLLLSAVASTSHSREPRELLTSPLAEAFGSTPIIRGSKLSPDGTRLSSIQMHPSGTTVLLLTNLGNSSSAALMAGVRDEQEIDWCDWANDNHLLCGLRLMEEVNRRYLPTTRLISISTETAEIVELFDRQYEDVFQQYQDRVIDWLPDDPDHVLIQRAVGGGYGVGRVNILNGRIESAEAGRERVYEWITDGHGVARAFRRTLQASERWYVRDTPAADWRLFRERQLTDLDAGFSPIGFGESRDELLYLDRLAGRWALFGVDLTNGDSTRVVYAHPEFDVASVRSLGKYSRLVAASYADVTSHYHFFDNQVAEVHAAVSRQFPNMLVDVLDEDWARRHYLLYVSSAEDPGTYYRYDSEQDELLLIARAYPLLEGHKLIPMRPVEYSSDDGSTIPAYLTAPLERTGPQAAVVLPHGGPSSRDYWSYDFLAQFLAANDYVVLQSNYRGSAGYGELWEGDGGFQGWRRAVADLNAGFRYLVEEGLAAEDQICIVGWSYGGYAALMSVIEDPNLYRCVVSVAGVTDPEGLADYNAGFVGGLSARTFIGTEDEVLNQGSPVERADEIEVPVLLLQGQKDVNVPASQASGMQRALRAARADYELIEYDHAEHSIDQARYRTDLLVRLAQFLDEHTERD